MEVLSSFGGAMGAPWLHAILIGTWFGLLHAFDADHLATIGGLAAANRSASVDNYAVRWALGHAVALGAIAALVLGLGMWGIAALSTYAELLVGLALVGLGAYLLRAALHRWAGAAEGRAAEGGRSANATAAALSRAGNAGVWMGLLHGGAGSAAVLALVPLARFDSGLQSAAYIACFSGGVALGALGFARVFSVLSARTARAGRYAGALWQIVVGVAAVAAGAWLLVETAGAFSGDAPPFITLLDGGPVEGDGGARA